MGYSDLVIISSAGNEYVVFTTYHFCLINIRNYILILRLGQSSSDTHGNQAIEGTDNQHRLKRDRKNEYDSS